MPRLQYCRARDVWTQLVAHTHDGAEHSISILCTAPAPLSLLLFVSLRAIRQLIRERDHRCEIETRDRRSSIIPFAMHGGRRPEHYSLRACHLRVALLFTFKRALLVELRGGECDRNPPPMTFRGTLSGAMDILAGLDSLLRSRIHLDTGIPLSPPVQNRGPPRQAVSLNGHRGGRHGEGLASTGKKRGDAGALGRVAGPHNEPVRRFSPLCRCKRMVLKQTCKRIWERKVDEGGECERRVKEMRGVAGRGEIMMKRHLHFRCWVKAVAQAAVIPGHRTDRGLEVSCVVWRHTPPPPASCELPPVDFPLCADRILGGIPGWAGPRRRAYRACPRTTLTLSSCSLAFPCLFA